jgi:TrmH family RNA methyltransferase
MKNPGLNSTRETITSLQNPRVKHVVRLRDRRGRDAAGELVIEGTRALRRALDCGYRPHTVYFAVDLLQGASDEVLLTDAAAAGAALQATSAAVLRKMAYRSQPEGVIGVGHQLGVRLDEMQPSECPLLVVTVDVEKPGNLGAILRSADAVGADGVIVCDGGTDVHNPNVIWSSTGAIFSVPIAEARSVEAIAWLRARGIRILATTPHADTEYTAIDLCAPIAIVMGSEQAGLTPTWLDAADLCARIPMRGLVDSLNVAMSTTVLLYEALRQRRVASRARAEKGEKKT